MSLKTMPILFLNMGGEMVYILEQRLHAQTVKQDKTMRVMTDIVGTMFSKKFIEEIFKPQVLYSRKGMRALFEKLAHASIMRLNATSMDKLYDLMTMACKYQLQMCTAPHDILLVTLNHLDGIRKVVQGVSNVQALIDHAYELLELHYFNMSSFELHMVRSTLLAFYQDARVKVSLLLREKKQRDDGRFVIATKGGKVPFGGNIPGTIKNFNNGQPCSSASFNSGGSYAERPVKGSLAKTAKKNERSIEYGTNMYKSSVVDTQGGYGSSAAANIVPPSLPSEKTEKPSSSGRGSSGDSGSKRSKSNSRQQDPGIPAPKDIDTKDELKLLCKLLSGKNEKRPRSSSKSRKGSAERDSPKSDRLLLSLFENEDDEHQFVQDAEKAVLEENAKIIKIDASKRDNRDLNKMMNELDVKPKENKTKKSKGDDLLDLMDSTND